MTTAETVMNAVQLAGGIILSIGYVPQIAKIAKTKDVKSFSLPSILAVFTGIGCMEAYAIYQFFGNGVAGAFFATNTMAFTVQGILLALVYLFRKN